MLPGFLFPSYKQYKTDSDAVATWLANTAEKCGYPKDLLTNQTSSQQKAPKLKGRARTKAREAAQKKATDGKSDDLKSKPTPEGPKYLITINDFISLAEWISKSTKPRIEVPIAFASVLDRAITVRKRHHSWWYSQNGKDHSDNKEKDQANESHAHFIGVLDKVRELLQPLMPTKFLDAPSRRPDEKASTPEDSASGHLTNLFESLDIEEPSDTFLNSESSSEQQPTSKPHSRYTVNQAPDLEEVYFAVHCLFNDLDNIRRYLQQVWDGYKQGAFDLVAASITTNTAIDFARSLEEDYIETFPGHTSFETHVNVLYMQVSYANGYEPGFKERPDDEMNFAIYREAETMLFPTYMLLSSFMDVVEPGTLPMYKPGHFGVYEPASDRAPKSSRDKFREDKVLLLETLPDFCVFAQMPGSIPAEDELTRGIRQMVEKKEVPIWLTFAAQIFLDIHHTLREQVGIGFHDLIKSASYAGNNIERVMEFHNHLRIENWPRSNDRVLHQILDRITDWVKTDVVQDARIKLTRRSGFQPPPTESFQLLKRHPLYCGLLSYSIKALVQEASITFVNAWGSVVYCAHLYNALRQERLISSPWQDMDLALLMHRTKDIFIGDFPRSIEDYAKRFSLAMGVSPTMLGNNRRQAGLKVSKSGPRQLNYISPVSEMFKARYCGNESRTNLSPDDIDSVLKKYSGGDEDDDSDSEWTTPKIEINVPDDPFPAPPDRERRTQKSRKRRRRTQLSARTGVRPIQLLNALLNAIQAETIELTFDHFRLHTFSWRLLRSIKEAIGDDLREIFGPGYLTRENQLPFIVGYILYTAVQTKNLGGMLVSKKKDVVTSQFLVRAAAAMREMLEAGAGAIELKMLQTQFGMEIEVPDILELAGSRTTRNDGV